MAGPAHRPDDKSFVNCISDRKRDQPLIYSTSILGGREAGYVLVSLCRPPTLTATRWRLKKFLAALNEVQAPETALPGEQLLNYR
ncbi:hypothetical protein DL770_005925 [Monosporascus sp. CRB-9-2]|nr:hypothetical protein DL770_005925 [Monosporascus sp. CRB-9-2]